MTQHDADDAATNSHDAADGEDLADILASIRELMREQLHSQVPNREVIMRCARGLEEAGQYGEAYDIYHQLYQQSYNPTAALYHMTNCQFKQGYIVHAKHLLQQLKQRDPTNPVIIRFEQEFEATKRREGKLALLMLGVSSFTVGMMWLLLRSRKQPEQPAAANQYWQNDYTPARTATKSW